MTTPQEIEDRFRFHAGTEKTIPMHTAVRTQHRGLAHWVNDNVPNSRERSLSLTALQESMMWCNAAIAINLAPVE